MLNISKYIKLDLETLKSPNLCDRFSAEDLQKIGDWVHTGYTQDKQSRTQWEQRNEAAMNLAMQVQKAKTFPWPDCSNVVFPLVSIGAQQFHARAYPAIVSGPDIVQYRVGGKDPDGTQADRADRVGQHMSWQLLEQDQAWEEQHDRTLITLPITGCAFKKSYFGGERGYNISELVLAKDLVMNYYAKSVESCPRKTHIIPMFRNEIYERCKKRTFREELLDEAWYKGVPAQQPPVSNQQAQANTRSGQQPPTAGDETTPFQFLEQHCSLDLDGDGYAEPYIITIEDTSHYVARIVCRFERMADIEYDADETTILSIRAMEYFTKYTFLPSPDGSIYDIGFGVLLGPLNESVNSLINQLIDAGTMSIAAGGFLARGAKIRGGVYTFAPFEWKRIDSSGDDLRKSLVPLPVREPSNVLFQLLSLLVNYVNRLAGSTDMSVGENPGQNTPAETARTMVEQGQKIYSAIFKRIWRAQKEEYKKLYILNGLNLSDNPTEFGTGGIQISRKDYLYDPGKIRPVADPNVTSDTMKAQQAMTLRQLSRSANGYDLDAVEIRVLRDLKIESYETVFKGSGKVPPLPNPKLQVEQAKLQGKMAELKIRQAEMAHSAMEEQRLNNAKIELMQAQAAKLIAEIGAERAAQQVEAFNSVIEMLKSRNDLLGKHLDIMKKQMEVNDAASESNADGGGVGGMAQSSLHQTPPQVGGEGAPGANGAMGAGGVQ